MSDRSKRQRRRPGLVIGERLCSVMMPFGPDRKFLGIIYRTLKYKWVFEDFPNFVLAEPAEAA